MTETDVAATGFDETQTADAALVAALNERSPAACAALYDRFAAGLLRFAAARLGGDVQSAEDIVVETMADAVRDIRRFSPRKSSLSAWIYGIARRRVWLEIRRQKRRKSVPTTAQVPLGDIPERVVGQTRRSSDTGRQHGKLDGDAACRGRQPTW